MNSFRFSEHGTSYWNSSALYFSLYEKLWNNFVPNEGKANTVGGELIRAISRLSYEYYNNGNCNARDIVEEEVENYCYDCNGEGVDDEGEDCESCGGQGYTYDIEEVDTKIEDYYYNLLYYIKNNCNFMQEDVQRLVKQIENLICNEYLTFSDDEAECYEKLTDIVVYYVYYILNYREKFQKDV